MIIFLIYMEEIRIISILIFMICLLSVASSHQAEMCDQYSETNEPSCEMINHEELQESKFESNLNIKNIQIYTELNSSFFQNLTSYPTPWFIIIGYPKTIGQPLTHKSWSKLESIVQSENLKINLAKINLLQNKIFHKRFNFVSFPSFVYLYDGYIYHYTGPSKSTNLLHFLKSDLFLQYPRQVHPLPSSSLPLSHSLSPRSFLRSMIGCFIIQCLLLYFCCGIKPFARNPIKPHPGK